VTRHGLHPPNVLAPLLRTTLFLALMRPSTLSATANLTQCIVNCPARCQWFCKGRGIFGQIPNPGTAVPCQSNTTMFPKNPKSP
jgi:hypothetical protein